MICGSHSIFFLSFLSFMPLGVFSEIIERTVECGKDVTISAVCNGTLTCNQTSEINKVYLKLSKSSKLSVNISDMADTKRHCSDDGKFCFTFEGRKNMTLTIHNVTFGDQGKYILHSERSDNKTPSNAIDLNVEGVCDPVLSSSQDKLTCNVSMGKNYTPEITWMDKNRKIHQSEKPLENKTEYVSEWHQYLMLTDETRKVQMCCSVRYKENGTRLEKQICTDEHLPNPEETDRQSQEMNTKKRVIPILIIACLLILAIAVAVYFSYRRRRPPPFPWPRRGDDQEEDRETTSAVPLQEP